MKKLDVPGIDDEVVLDNVANGNHASARTVELNKQRLLTQYDNYELQNGNPKNITADNFSENVKKAFRKLYFSRPVAVSFIDSMRDEYQHRVCPMCGSSHAGTIEHVLPKEDFAEFSIYSHNLVPGCKCNVNHGKKVTGDMPKERILHPYYDNILQDRLLKMKIDEPCERPKVDVVNALDATHPMFETVEFHIDLFPRRNNINYAFIDKWVNLLEKPERILSRVDLWRDGFSTLQDVIQLEVDRQDDIHGTPNNWDSAFLVGCLNLTILEWLERKIT